MSRAHWSDSLPAYACGEAREWCRTQPSLAAAWARCERGDWMLWLIGDRERSAPWSEERKLLAVCAVECALSVLELPLSDDVRCAVELVAAAMYEWANGGDPECVRMARDYAAAAAAAAAADAAHAAAYAAAAARARSLARSADIVRAHYPRPPRLGGGR